MSSSRDAHGALPSSPQNAQRPKVAPKKEMRADFLLNFSRPAPASNQRPQNYAPPRRSQPQGRGARSAAASFAKGRFVQSSFRILTDGLTPDVVEATLNADHLLDWSSVCRVDLQCEELLKCPICLEEEMVVPKITKCGHVFCVSCVFRYFLALQEYNGRFWQKCPVCNHQQVSPEELVSVRLDPVKVPREGDRVRFVLARRNASSTVVRPPPQPAGAGASSGSSGGGGGRRRRPGGGDEGPWVLPVEGEDGWNLSRLARLATGDFYRMLTEEMDTLRAFRAACLTCGDTELLPSIDAAGKSLQQLRAERAREGPDDGIFEALELPESAVDAAAEAPTAAAAAASAAADDEDEGAGAAGSVPPSPGSAVPPSPGTASRTSPSLVSAPSPAIGGGGAHGNPAHKISFYQADDGRLIFLQPLFTRFLLHEHGGEWSGLPLDIPDLRLERVQDLSLNEETRKRHRFLSHLPLGTAISFVEVDLRNLLSKETKEHFAEDFQKIRESRKRDQAKSRHEDRVSKSRAATMEEQYYAAFNRPHPSTVTLQVLPTKEDFVPLPGREGAPGGGAEGTGDAADGDGAAEESGGETGPTLAEKLKERMAVRARPGDPKRFPKLGGGGPDRFPKLGGGGGGSGGSGGPSASSSAPAAGRIGSAAPAASAAAGPGAGSAWGTKLAATTAKKAAAAGAAGAPSSSARASRHVVKDAWDEDSGDEAAEAAEARRLAESAEAAAAFDAALLRSSGGGAAAAAAAAGGEGVAEGEADAGGPGSKKKKGRAGKATTIRLFG